MNFVTWKEFVELKDSLQLEEDLTKKEKAAHKKPGGSNVGEERETSGAHEGPFCGPSGGAPEGSYPVTSKKQGAFAKAYSHNAPNPEGIKKCVDRVLGKKKD